MLKPRMYCQTATKVIGGRCDMATYVIMNRFSPDTFSDPKEFKDLAALVSEKFKS